jgi:low temperature requirement protein LtrA
MVAGIIVTAAADELVLSHPASAAHASIGWMILGGTALFLAGHAAFKLTVWRVISWTRLAALLALASLGLLGPQLSAVALGSLAAAVIIAVAISDRLLMGWLTLLPVID